jgi:hypothetical protein
MNRPLRIRDSRSGSEGLCGAVPSFAGHRDVHDVSDLLMSCTEQRGSKESPRHIGYVIPPPGFAVIPGQIVSNRETRGAYWGRAIAS